MTFLLPIDAEIGKDSRRFLRCAEQLHNPFENGSFGCMFD
jgi:hypothetical protein